MIEIVSKEITLQPITKGESLTLTCGGHIIFEDYICPQNGYVKIINIYKFENEFNLIQGYIGLCGAKIELTLEHNENNVFYIK